MGIMLRSKTLNCSKELNNHAFTCIDWSSLDPYNKNLPAGVSTSPGLCGKAADYGLRCA